MQDEVEALDTTRLRLEQSLVRNVQFPYSFEIGSLSRAVEITDAVEELIRAVIAAYDKGH
jgi:hypothetical protein